MGLPATIDDDVSQNEIEIAKANLGDWRWRMNNLYYIVDRNGKKSLFKLNWAQEQLFNRLWSRDLILKARQLGMTTAIQIFILDQCLFNDNTRAGVVAHGLVEAQDIFENKIKFAYDNLPSWLRAVKPTVRSSGKQIKFKNGSFVRVGTSMRSGNFDILHVSEFGKICRQYPERAREIVTGSFPAVSANGIIFIESTAEGEQGYFYEYSEEARKMMVAALRLTNHDYRFFFFSWWSHPEYELSDDHAKLVEIPDRLENYFYTLESEQGIVLSEGRKAWYVKQEKLLGDDMFREYPSTPEEAFKQVVKGAYFIREFADVHRENRITSVPYHRGIPVDTWWDLGMSDMMCVFFTQTVGGWVHVINYYENSGRGMKHYIDILRGEEKAWKDLDTSFKESVKEMRDYSYGRHYGPHDLEVRELMGDGRSRVQKAKDFGIQFEVVPRVSDKHDAIDAARDALPVCIFDEVNCARGLTRLKEYRREWDQKLGRYKDQPLHDVNSNGADAYMTMATGHPMFRGNVGKGRARQVQRVKSGRMI